MAQSYEMIVFIKSILSGFFIRLDGSKITSYQTQASPSVYAVPEASDVDRFYFEAHNDGTHSFRSVQFDNVYLSLNAADVQPGFQFISGGGYVSAQYGCSDHAKFRLHRQQSRHLEERIVGLESVAFPGRFLRCDGFRNLVNVQGVMKEEEEFRFLLAGIE